MLDFLGIGAQKAATTWLFRHLSRHPQVAFPAGKEVRFWDRNRERGVDWWLGLFGNQGGDRKKGEITPAYAILDPATIGEVHRCVPASTRLFYSIRNPVERAWSGALMALERSELTIEEASDQWFVDHFRSRDSRLRGDYEACLRNWREVFGPERIQVIVFDDVVATPQAVLQGLARHLGVGEAPFSQFDEAGLRKAVFAGPGTPIRPALAAALRDLYGPQIDRLSEYLGRDFSHWKRA